MGVGDVSLLGEGGVGESAWLLPCMVLVINDNLYGLIFVLSYIRRCVHMSCLISICWNQG